MIKKIWLFLAIVAFLYSCKREEVSFVMLKQYESLDSIRTGNEIYIVKHYSVVVNNYREDDKVTASIDSFAHVLMGSKPYKYVNLSIVFYKSSDVTNVEHLKENPRDIDRYSQDNDMIYVYEWSKGNLWRKEKIY